MLRRKLTLVEGLSGGAGAARSADGLAEGEGGGSSKFRELKEELEEVLSSKEAEIKKLQAEAEHQEQQSTNMEHSRQEREPDVDNADAAEAGLPARHRDEL